MVGVHEEIVLKSGSLEKIQLVAVHARVRRAVTLLQHNVCNEQIIMCRLHQIQVLQDSPSPEQDIITHECCFMCHY